MDSFPEIVENRIKGIDLLLNNEDTKKITQIEKSNCELISRIGTIEQQMMQFEKSIQNLHSLQTKKIPKNNCHTEDSMNNFNLMKNSLIQVNSLIDENQEKYRKDKKMADSMMKVLNEKLESIEKVTQTKITSMQAFLEEKSTQNQQSVTNFQLDMKTKLNDIVNNKIEELLSKSDKMKIDQIEERIKEINTNINKINSEFINFKSHLNESKMKGDKNPEINPSKEFTEKIENIISNVNNAYLSCFEKIESIQNFNIRMEQKINEMNLSNHQKPVIKGSQKKMPQIVDKMKEKVDYSQNPEKFSTRFKSIRNSDCSMHSKARKDNKLTEKGTVSERLPSEKNKIIKILDKGKEKEDNVLRIKSLNDQFTSSNKKGYKQKADIYQKYSESKLSERIPSDRVKEKEKENSFSDSEGPEMRNSVMTYSQNSISQNQQSINLVQPSLDLLNFLKEKGINIEERKTNMKKEHQ